MISISHINATTLKLISLNTYHSIIYIRFHIQDTNNMNGMQYIYIYIKDIILLLFLMNKNIIYPLGFRNAHLKSSHKKTNLKFLYLGTILCNNIDLEKNRIESSNILSSIRKQQMEQNNDLS